MFCILSVCNLCVLQSIGLWGKRGWCGEHVPDPVTVRQVQEERLVRTNAILL